MLSIGKRLMEVVSGLAMLGFGIKMLIDHLV